MDVIAGFVDWAALPQFRGSRQLASDKYLKTKDMSWDLESMSKHFKSGRLPSGSPSSSDHDGTGRHQAAVEGNPSSIWVWTLCSSLPVLRRWHTWQRIFLSGDTCQWLRCRCTCHLGNKSVHSITHGLPQKPMCSFLYTYTELLLPMVFNEVVSGDWCRVRCQGGDAVVDEEASLSCIRTSVRRLQVQEVSNVGGTGEHLAFPVTYVSTKTSLRTCFVKLKLPQEHLRAFRVNMYPSWALKRKQNTGLQVWRGSGAAAAAAGAHNRSHGVACSKQLTSVIMK